jgi:hypothetical protein
MNSPGFLASMLIIAGAVLPPAGVLLTFADRIPLLGKLPGDFRLERSRFTLYVPLASSLILSILLTVLLNLIGRR